MDLLKCPKLKQRHTQNQRGQRLYKQLLSNAACSLNFSDDVMVELGSKGIPYSQTDFRWLFNSSELLPSRKKLEKNTYNSESRKPATLKKEVKHSEDIGCLPALPPVLQDSNAVYPKDTFTLPAAPQGGGMLESPKRTDIRGTSNVYNCLKEASAGGMEDRSKTCHWDEFLLKKLTKTTAQWIVGHQIPNNAQNKQQLISLLKDQYGAANVNDLVSEEPMTEEDFSLFQEIRKKTQEKSTPQSSKAEMPLPVYYRVQGYSMPLPTNTEPGHLNRTVNTVAVKHIEPLLPPRLQDCLNPRAGSHVLHTENPFEQELFSGIAKQVHQLNPRMHDRIIMDNNSEYRKNLQEVYPSNPDNWTHSTAMETLPDADGVYRVKRGFCRWVDLPTKADYATEVGLRPPDYSGHDTKVPTQQINYIPMQELSSLRYAIEEWRKAWKIQTSWKSVTIEGLLKDLKDLHDHVRIAAIATCASGAVNRPREESVPIETGQFGRVWDIQAVPQELHPLLNQALEDPVERVQMAAAVCQYAMGIPHHRAREILYSAICQDSISVGADSWVAAQCLAMEGEHSRAVIQRLLAQQSLSKAPSDKEQAASLLASISSKTTLVRSLLAEELNCANWRARLLACNSLSQLKGPVNKDVGNKLIYLMWNDWNSAVRQTAAQALGKLGRGRDLHNELRMKLEGFMPARRVEALMLLGQLQVMTAKLLPILLSCLNDDFVSVRKQACLTAAALLMKNDMILNQLIHLMQTDPAWEVKVCAINALGKIGCLTANLQELLLQAVHHEEQPDVRIAACEALAVLKAQGPDLQHVLQERFVVETHPVVHRHIEELLRSCGYSMEGDQGMVQKIRSQVHRLCNKYAITEKVILMEELEEMLMQQKRFLADGSSQPPISQMLQERYIAVSRSPSRVLLDESDSSDAQQRSESRVVLHYLTTSNRKRHNSSARKNRESPDEEDDNSS